MPEAVVVGLGNLLVSDEGFGVQAVRRFQERFGAPDAVEVVDGGTLGLKLLPILDDAERIVLVDAVDVAGEPGTLVRIGWDDVRRALPVKISPHQETVTEVLGLRELRRGRPEGFEIIGVQPGSLEMGTELSPPVAARLDEAVDAVVAILRGWGYDITEHRADGRADGRPGPLGG